MASSQAKNINISKYLKVETGNTRYQLAPFTWDELVSGANWQ